MRIVANEAGLKKIVALRGEDALRKPRVALPEQVEESLPVRELVPVAPPVVNVAVDLEGLSQGNAALASTIIKVLEAQKPATPSEPAARITEWQFDVQRDDKGFIKGMTAKAK